MVASLTVDTPPHVAPGDTAAANRGRRNRKRASTIGYHTMMIVVAALYLVPISFVVSSSLRTSHNMYDPAQWIPRPLTFSHYANLLKTLPHLGRYVWNTAFIAVLSTAGTLVSSALAGYALARFHFPGGRIVMGLLLLTLMFPPQITLVPLFNLFRILGLINTPWPIIIPMLFGTPFVTFFFRQYFLTIPAELDEAALVDGANRFQAFRLIILPSAKPAIVTMGLITFIQQWNNYFGPSVYLQTENQWVLSQGITSLIGTYTSQQGEIMAGTILMSLPIVLLYLLGQRYIVEGITATGLNG